MYPNETAAAMASPSVADLPRPLAAVIVTVGRSVCSDMVSTNLSTAFACGMMSTVESECMHVHEVYSGCVCGCVGMWMCEAPDQGFWHRREEHQLVACQPSTLSRTLTQSIPPVVEIILVT